MKLICDLCGGELQMTAGGQSAACTNCGITYSLERLREKLGASSADSGKTGSERVNPPAPDRRLYIKRKVDLLMLSKAAVIIDGQQCGILAGQGKEFVFPVSRGTHTISFRAADGSGITEMDELTFHVGDHDWYGEFWLHRGAFKAEYRFEMRELV